MLELVAVASADFAGSIRGGGYSISTAFVSAKRHLKPQGQSGKM